MNKHLQYLLILGCFLPLWAELITLLLVFIVISNKSGLIIDRKFFHFFIFIFVISGITIFVNDYSYDKFFQQACLILIFVTLYYSILTYKNWDLEILFHRYLTISFYVCMIGILQWIVFYFSGINIFNLNGSLEEIRVTSIIGEPGGLAQIILPAVIYYFRKVIKEKNLWNYRALIIIGVFLLTSSAAGYLIFAVYLMHHLWKMLRFKIFLFLFPILFLLIGLKVITIPDKYEFEVNGNDIATKFSETLDGISHLSPAIFENTNASSYAFLSNLYVSMESNSRILGTGLGTHSESYKKVYKPGYVLYGLNMEDAYSLGIRIFSELGVLGIFFLLFFIFKNYNSQDEISVAIFYLFLFVIIRGGNYALYGLIFFAIFYYLRKKEFDYRSLNSYKDQELKFNS